MVQKQDYFALVSTGFVNGSLAYVPTAYSASSMPTANSTAYYLAEYNGSAIPVGYSFLYWNGTPFSNPLTQTESTAIPYYGAISINDMVLVLDKLNISNSSANDLVVDILSATPANSTSQTSPYAPTINPTLLERVMVGAKENVQLDSLDLELPLHANIPSLVPNTTQTYFMSGYGVAVAFPQSFGATTASNYSIEVATITGIAHFERD